MVSPLPPPPLLLLLLPPPPPLLLLLLLLPKPSPVERRVVARAVLVNRENNSIR